MDVITSYSIHYTKLYDQFGQWIHQPAANGYRTPNGNIVIGELVAGHFGGRVDGSAGFVDHKHFDVAIERNALDEIFGLPAGGTIANGDGFT